MSKVYGYCRLALADSEGMKEQIRLIGEYCENHNLKLDGYFCDNGCTGFKTGEEFTNLLGELKQGDTVVIRDISRLSRDVYKCMDLTNIFKNMGVTLEMIN